MSGTTRAPDADRLRAELALLQARFSLLVEHSSEAIYIKDVESRYVYINPAGAAMMHRLPEELIGQDDNGVFSPDVVAEIRADDLLVMRTAQAATIRTARVLNTGERIDFLTVKRPWFDAGGRVIGVVGTTRDVSELVGAQREAAASAEGFRALVEAIPELVFVHRAGIVLYANPAAASALARSENELVGALLSDLVRAEDRSAVASSGFAFGRVEVGFLRPDGAIVLAEISGVAATWCGEPAWVALGRDISARRRMEAQLRDTDRLAAVGMLATGIAHEIRNPLTFVLGAASELRRVAVDGSVRARLADIEDAGERIGAILEGVSGLARSESSGAMVVDVEVALDRALVLAGYRLRERASVERLRGPSAPVIGSERRLVQVFVNLLVNAAQAVSESAGAGVVRIHTERQVDRVVVRVRDSGPGIPVALAARLFEPFVTTKPTGEGTGLGLWVSRGVVEEVGGRLELENPGQPGASFSVTLRAAAAPAGVGERSEPPSVALMAASPVRSASPSGSAPAPPPAASAAQTATGGVPLQSRKPRLLVVDDERMITDLLSEGLAGAFEVSTAGGVLSALRVVAEEAPFDIVLCDLIMPDGGGSGLFDGLSRGGRVRPPMVFMSGGAATPEARGFLERERIVPIDKPFRIGDVRRRLLLELGARTNPDG